MIGANPRREVPVVGLDVPSPQKEEMCRRKEPVFLTLSSVLLKIMIMVRNVLNSAALVPLRLSALLETRRDLLID